jgi:hypothetical protein
LRISNANEEAEAKGARQELLWVSGIKHTNLPWGKVTARDFPRFLFAPPPLLRSQILPYFFRQFVQVRFTDVQFPRQVFYQCLGWRASRSTAASLGAAEALSEYYVVVPRFREIQLPLCPGRFLNLQQDQVEASIEMSYAAQLQEPWIGKFE